MHVQSCSIANLNLLRFCCSPVAVAETPYCCDPEILLPWERDVTLLFSIVVAGVSGQSTLHDTIHAWQAFREQIAPGCYQSKK